MEFPRERLETLIAGQATRTPEAIAVAFEDRGLTYAELDARANQLAHRIRELGAGSGDLVGICLPRSERMLVALLGTLKAGAAYVPIDPAYPAERQRYMLEDADVRRADHRIRRDRRRAVRAIRAQPRYRGG